MCNISVIMSIYSEPLEWLVKSIESILAQDFQEIEFIIVNDNPERLELNGFLASYKSKFSNIIILKNEKNLGLIKSLNKGIECASGKYIARMDADDIALPHRLSTQLNYILKYKYDLIGANVEVISEIEEKMYDSNKIITDKYVDSVLLLGTVPLVHPTYLGKAEVFKVCRYNEKATYAEDMEFIAHARTLGYRIGNCPEILLKYRFNEASITKSNAYISYNTAMSVKKAFSVFKKNGVYHFIQLLEVIDNNKIKKFNNRQIFMNFAKREFKKRNILKGSVFLLRAMISDISFFRLIHINMMQRIFVHKDIKK